MLLIGELSSLSSIDYIAAIGGSTGWGKTDEDRRTSATDENTGWVEF